MTDLVLRTGTPEDADALFGLIQSHAQEGHLLPRALDEVSRFVAPAKVRQFHVA